MLKQTTELKPCFTYCRVSSQTQIDKGHGLDTQLADCKKFADHYGYEIIESFQDLAISGADRARKGLDDLLKSTIKKPGYAIIFPNTKRLARDFLWSITAIDKIMQQKDRRVIFCDCPDVDIRTNVGMMQFQLQAVFAEYEKKGINSTTQNGRLRQMQSGRYVEKVPFGYNKLSDSPSKLITPNHHAPVVKNVMENFANGVFQGYKEVERHLASIGIYKKSDTIKTMFSNPIYAGYIHRPDIEIDMWDSIRQNKRNALHEPIIDLKTYLKNMEIITGTVRSSYKAVINNSFYLKKIAKCWNCSTNLTAEVKSKTKGVEYIYYKCTNRHCCERSKTINFNDIELEILSYLKANSIGHIKVAQIQEYLKKHFVDQKLKNKNEERRIKARIATLETEMNKLVDTMVKCENPQTINILENKITEKNNEIVILTKDLINFTQLPRDDIQDVSNLLLEMSKNLDELYIKCGVDHRRNLLNIVFPEGFIVHKIGKSVYVSNNQKSPLCADYWGDFEMNYSLVDQTSVISNFSYYDGLIKFCQDKYLAIVSLQGFALAQ